MLEAPDPAERPPSDWDRTRRFLRAHPTRWGSLSWVASRPLIASLNDKIARFSGGLVTLGRAVGRGGPAPGPPPTVELPGTTSFIVLGDTGEQDGSQYVVAPELSRATAELRPGFVMIMSDVIYPAGNVNDYVDGAYLPYRSADPNFRVEAPIFALPGNHDWYDGLFGFMHHFTSATRAGGIPEDSGGIGLSGAPPLPPRVYTPTGSGWRTPIHQFFRVLWRRPSLPQTAASTARAMSPLTRDLRSAVTHHQPGPYYAIDTGHLLVVAIDTGIDGTIDDAQWRWLNGLPAERPKLLVTGKPLLVNAQVKPTAVGPAPKDPRRGDSVWNLVNRPGSGYVATVGGDVHNYQKYEYHRADSDRRPRLHLVAGGSGAYMHATHPYAMAGSDSRLQHNRRRWPWRQPSDAFPDPRTSLEYFAGLLVPSLMRTWRNLVLVAVGVGVLLALTGGGSPDRVSTARAAGWVALSLLAVVALIRAVRRRDERSAPVPRALTAVASGLSGVLGAALALRFDAQYFRADLLFWAAVTAYHCLLNVAVRRAGWWRPADEFNRNLTWPIFFGGLLALAGLGGLLQWWSAGPVAWRLTPALIGAALLILVGALGWFARRPRLRAAAGSADQSASGDVAGGLNALWYRWGTSVAIGTQALFFALAVSGFSARVGRLDAFVAAGLSVLGCAGILLATGVVTVLLTDLIALFGLIRADWADSWGRVARIMHFAVVWILLAAVAGWVWLADHLGRRAAGGLPILLFGLVAGLLLVDWLRRELPKAYLPTILLLGGAGVIYAYGAPPWPLRQAIAAALIVAVVGLTITVGHLFFLRAQSLLLRPRLWRRKPAFSQAEFTAILAARATVPPGEPDVHPDVWLWARLTAPGIGEPGGVLQKGIAEIFSVDEPPFYKSFLSFASTPSELTITLHTITGSEPAARRHVATLPLW